MAMRRRRSIVGLAMLGVAAAVGAVLAVQSYGPVVGSVGVNPGITSVVVDAQTHRAFAFSQGGGRLQIVDLASAFGADRWGWVPLWLRDRIPILRPTVPYANGIAPSVSVIAPAP